MITAELLKEVGLDEEPEAHYDDLPQRRSVPNFSEYVNHAKAVKLIDPLLTAKFARFYMDHWVIDQTLDARVWYPDICSAAMVRTDVPPLVNAQVSRHTGILPVIEQENFLRWLAMECDRFYTEMHASAMAPPQIFTTDAIKGKSIPYIGAMLKVSVKVPDGKNLQDIMAGYAYMPKADEPAPIAIPKDED